MSHKHIGSDKCIAIDERVCLRTTVHGGSKHIRERDGAIAGGPDEHIAGYIVAHDLDGHEVRDEGALFVDPHFADRPQWTQSGSLEAGDLTLSPSVLCSCGFHGWIREGKWVSA